MSQDVEGSFTRRRAHMVQSQIRARSISDRRVVDAMGEVPRHLFVPPGYREYAYEDGPLPIGEGQTISQPYIVALMCQLVRLHADDTVLEVGTGSGYGAAVLSLLCRQVHTIERHAGLARLAARVLADLRMDNVRVHVGDGTQGLPDFAPYQAIVVTAAAPQVPEPLLAQLDDGGRLVLPVGELGAQMLERWVRNGTRFDHDSVAPVAFVPLIGKHGWQD